MRWKIILSVILGLLVIITIVITYGHYHWQAETKKMHADLEAARQPIEPKTFDDTVH